MGVRWSSSRGVEKNGVVARRRCGGNPVSQRGHVAVEGEEGCDGVLGVHLRWRMRGEREKGWGWHGGDGAPFVGDMVGSGGQLAGGSTRR
jgi:hypothetical protein